MINLTLLVIQASDITVPIMIIGGLGLAFGVILAVASKFFAVESDPRIDMIIDVLPGANCGACGMPGCGGYADAIVHSDAPINKCAPGGETAMAKIAAIMGKAEASSEKQIAVYHCTTGGYKNTNWKFTYEGVESCVSAVNTADGPNACLWGCMGFNDCVRACQFDAITVDEFGMRCVNPEKCTACGACVKICPRQIPLLVGIKYHVYIRCSSKDKGPLARTVCGSSHPCIGCGLCVNKCPTQAITLAHNLARIDYTKCIDCGLCATVCPTKCIDDTMADCRPKEPVVSES
jgi:Na+-translocating ferredoxin:NAD+ oxidoreductase RNF subunit RnfB